MNELKNILEKCSIKKIFCGDNGTRIFYKIPIYQRNYAWERDEIYTLVKDVYDSMKTDKPVYYIGTLVTYRRDENVFEVIDGQQRLTTIYILLKAMGTESIANQLTYAARKVSASTLEKMPDFGEEYDPAIKQGFIYARQSLKDIVGERPDDVNRFKEYLLEKVNIIHYRVPKDVDLNHYFEVMNSRGEQLEKHEIVKAQLCDQLRDDAAAMEKFSQIWEACSDMRFYIQQKMPGTTKVFGKGMDSFALESFDGFETSSATGGTAQNMKSIAELIEEPVKPMAIEDGPDENDNFLPITDFPNLLLIVLKITRIMNEPDFRPTDFILDDKELLDEFSTAQLDANGAKQFAFNLLKAKFYLDNYMIHHTKGADSTKENPWKLQRYCRGDGKTAYLKDLSDDRMKQDELVQLLSMFEVAFSARQHKNYLFYCLLHLFDNDDVDDYLTFARKLADKYFFDVYLDAGKLNEANQPRPNSFDETLLKDGKLDMEPSGGERDFNSIFPIGNSNIPLFVFNYTDYKLWKKYADELRGEETKKGDEKRQRFFEQLGCSDFMLDPFQKFYFSRTRKSLEHYYPQAKAGEGKFLSTEQINCFGNLAMIGADANSSGSDWNPIEKNNRYLDQKSNAVSVASLKFRIMMQRCQDNYDEGVRNGDKRATGQEWDFNDISDHQEKMLEIIMEPSRTRATKKEKNK